MACVANRSTTVRKAIRPMMIERSTRPGECPVSCIVRMLTGTSVIAPSLKCSGPWTWRPGGLCWGIPEAPVVESAWGRRSLHIVVGRIPADVADIEDDGLLAEVLPPMRGAVDFRPEITRLVHDRIDTVAGVFHDLTLLHEDQRGPIVVAVPWHDAAGLDR